MIECWRIHPELMENKAADKHAVENEDDASNKQKGKEVAPLMILSSGKVVCNISAQSKEVKDNRGKSGAK